MSEEKHYQHTCKNPKCMKAFLSDARNTRYCSPECVEEMRKRHHQLGKRRRNYNKNSPMFRAESMSRRQAREFVIGEKVVHPCGCCGEVHKVKDLECAHRSQNCFDNSVENLALLCVPCHSQFDNLVRKLHPYVDGDNPFDPTKGPSLEEMMEMAREIRVWKTR